MRALWDFLKTYIAESQLRTVLKRLGVPKESKNHVLYHVNAAALEELRRVARAQHPDDPSHGKRLCACGAAKGGPAATPACLALLELLLRSEQLARLQREMGIYHPH
jgi:hypothetical protein